ncbi:MAG: nucleoside triphosphate pyrophosphohydrolase [Chloroflexi bacterium]|nr:nucleoside triphosphate pyrophosphohydrolase [Chloroflexota bacterium]
MAISIPALTEALAQLGPALADGLSSGVLTLDGGTDDRPHRLDARLPTLVSMPIGESMRAALSTTYPLDSPVRLVTRTQAGRDSAVVSADMGWALGNQAPPETAWLFALPLPWDRDLRDFRTLVEIIQRLRAPDGCPWDRAQTHRSLAPYLLEETYEALEEIDGGTTAALREELGDVLLQIALHSRIADEVHQFDVADVVEGLVSKLIRRHPHVFGDATAKTAAEAMSRWEVQKSSERGGASLMTGVPATMPALSYAQRVQDRAAGIGFDWPTIDGVLEKVSEEATELAEATTESERESELGDLLFSLVNLGRRLGVDVEAAARGANRRFVSRFKAMEEMAKSSGAALGDLALAEQDRLWDEAKRMENLDSRA